jgi:hypothetical protein
MNKCKQGYLRITLNDNKIRKCFKIHRLVSLAFLPNPENKAEVNHIDSRKDNNHISNLEWVTPKENMAHAKREGLMDKRNYKVSEGDVRGIRAMDGLHKDIAEKFNISTKHVSQIKNGKRRGTVK